MAVKLRDVDRGFTLISGDTVLEMFEVRLKWLGRVFTVVVVRLEEAVFECHLGMGELKQKYSKYISQRDKVLVYK